MPNDKIKKLINDNQGAINAILFLTIVFLLSLGAIVYAIVDKQNKEKDEVSETSTEEQDVSVSKYGNAYTSIILGKKHGISYYEWQGGYEFEKEYGAECINYPIALRDITGDDIPELFVAYCNEYQGYVADLDIYTLDENNNAKLIYTYTIDTDVAGGTEYYIFTKKGETGLYGYTSISDEGMSGYYYNLNFDESGNVTKKDMIGISVRPNEDYTDTITEYSMKGTPISQQDYLSVESELLDNMDSIIMYNFGSDIMEIINSKRSIVENCYYTYPNALRKLMCSEPTSDNPMPFTAPVEMYFTSGAGAWGTSISINPDGTFTGSYHDSNMGVAPEGCDAEVILSNCEGRFTNIKKIDDNTYSMELEYINYEKEIGETWIENNVYYVAAETYGISGGKEFLIYLPDTPVENLPEGYMNWTFGFEDASIPWIGMYNVSGEYGFIQ